MLRWSHGEGEAVVFNNISIAGAIEAEFLGTNWAAGVELFLQRPSSLPRTYRSIRPAVYDATLHRRRGRTVQVEAIAHPPRKRLDATAIDESRSDSERQITGTIIETRQNFVNSVNTDFAMECSFHVDTGTGTVSVGGTGAYLEDYVAEEITLMEV